MRCWYFTFQQRTLRVCGISDSDKQVKDRGGLPVIFKIVPWYYCYVNKNPNGLEINTEVLQMIREDVWN